MNNEFSNYFKRDFFEISAILGFIEEKKYPFNVNQFCNEWTEKNKNTQISRENIEKALNMSLENYLYKKYILKSNLNSLKKIDNNKLLNIYSSIKILSYILENQYSSDKHIIIKMLKNDEDLKRLGYSYDTYQQKYIDYKISNLFYSLTTYNFIKNNIKESKECIENNKNDILNELKERSHIIIHNNQSENKLDNSTLIDENRKLKLVFDNFLSEVINVVSYSENKNENTYEDFNKLKEEYNLVIKEKRNLEEKIKVLEKNIKDMNNRYIELQNTIKSKEYEANFKAVEDLYKILNDKQDLFLDKIYAAKHDLYNLNLEDIKRITSNIISNIESFGIRVNPMSKKVNEKIVIREEDLPNYRLDSEVIDKVMSNGSAEVNIKYPSWIYVDREYIRGIRNLDNEMIE